MGADCSCLREDPKLYKDEMTMQESKKLSIVQESAQENEKSEVVVDLQLPTNDNNRDLNKKTIKKEPKPDYTGIQSAARGYLDRKDLSAMKEINQVIKGFNPETLYVAYNGSLSSKVSSKAKKIEKQWGTYSPETSNEDNTQVTSHPAYILEDETVYEGEWNEDGEKHGKGIEIGEDGSKYVGYFKNNERSGDGRLITAEGDLYQGDFKKGKLNGKGILHRYDSSKYEGSFKNGVPHGKGSEEAEGWSYKGNFRNGQKHGKGVFSLDNGSNYEGDFKDNNMEGHGHYTWQDGREYDGEWKDNKMHGSGVFTWPDGRKYEGEYENDDKHGHGILTWPDGKKYDGEWKNGKQDGNGKMTFQIKKNGKFETRSGVWKDGVRIQWTKKEKGEE